MAGTRHSRDEGVNSPCCSVESIVSVQQYSLEPRVMTPENDEFPTASNGPEVQPVRRPLSRRQFMQIAGGAGFAALAFQYGLGSNYAFAAGSGGTSSLGTGTVPEQIHLTWGSDPSCEVTVSWALPIGPDLAAGHAEPRRGGQTVFGATPFRTPTA